MRKRCRECQSSRIAEVSGKCSDLFWARIGNREHDGYVPTDMGIGDDSDYVALNYCLDCGVIQGKFPIKKTALEKGEQE